MEGVESGGSRLFHRKRGCWSSWGLMGSIGKADQGLVPCLVGAVTCTELTPGTGWDSMLSCAQMAHTCTEGQVSAPG